jgi:hypothetical protein
VPNFVPEALEENKELSANRCKAKPPVPKKPLGVINKQNEQGTFDVFIFIRIKHEIRWKDSLFRK